MDTQEPSKERPSSANPGPPGANAAYPPPAYQQPANAFYGPTAHTQYPASQPMQNTSYTQYPTGHPMQNISYTQYPTGHPMQNTSYTQYPASHPMQNAVYPAGQNLVVTTQPMTIVSTTQAYTSDYLGYSIFTMLCCCLPLGIAALVFSLQAREANNRGDAAQARSSSRTALTINNVALGLGIAITVSWVAYVIYVNVAVRKYFVNYSYSSG